MTSKAKKVTFHVVFSKASGLWRIKRGTKAIPNEDSFLYKDVAVKRARLMAQAERPSRVVVHKRYVTA